MNQNARPKSGGISSRALLAKPARPAPHLSKVVPYGSGEEDAWEDWLAANGFPPLGRIGKRVDVGMHSGWDMPFSRPPRDPDSFDWGLAKRFAEWLWA